MKISEYTQLAVIQKAYILDRPSPDLSEPHILRSLANINAVSVHTSHSGCHAVVLDVHGTAHLFGRNASSCLGLPASVTPVVSEQSPRAIRPSHIGAGGFISKFVSAACGRAHTILITDSGNAYSAGINTLGQASLLDELLSAP
jgi:alpha-tubulin suppressor-like RCC1 family protein